VSESDSFIREVSEEVRRERFAHLLRRYGWIAALVLIALVGGAGLNEWMKARDRAAAQAAGDALREAYLVEAPEARAEALAAVAGEAPGAAPVARLAEAGALVEAGEPERAAEVLSAVAEDPAAGPLYRDLALLQRVAVLGAAMDRSERLAALETLTRSEGPFRPLALEQRALAHIEAGDVAAAHADLEALLALPTVPDGLGARARQLLVATGGSPDAAVPGPGVLPGAEVLPEANG
jgi:hypothetical protein